MPTTDRARLAVLALLAAVAGLAAVGLAVLAQAGGALCSHRVVLAVHHHAMDAMAGMPAAAPVPEAAGVCPCILYAAAVAAGLCVLAVVALAGSRSGAPAIVVQAARLVARLRLAPLTAAVALAGAIPLAAVLATDGVPVGLAAFAVLAALIAGALLTALGLSAGARLVLAFARRLVDALAAAFRLLAPGADAPWTPRRAPVFAAAGVRLARRQPSRAPPLR
jgi:hypothetical protein